LILSELTGYLAQHRRAALTDMANRFGSSPEALRAMLGVLERKGRVRRIAAGPGCSSGCCGCDQGAVETYEWIARAEPTQPYAQP
jgi:predicted transcriptional regulator of viral defense system